MNRNLDGSPLTREQLIDLALKAGFPKANVTRDVKTWVFSEASRKLRLAMFMRGELVLDTSPLPQPEPFVCQVDWDFVDAVSPNHPARPKETA